MEERSSKLPRLSEAEPMVNRLTAAQRLRVRQALVRQALHHVTKALPPEALDEGHRIGCRLASRWLECPTDEIAQEACICAGGECWDGGVRYYDYPEYFLTPVWVIGATDLDVAARLAAEAVPETLRQQALCWQIAAVQAIVRGEALLPEVS